MRYVLLILIAIVLVAPFGVREVLRPHNEAIKSDTAEADRLVIITAHNQDIRNEFAYAFSAWHREHYGGGVELDFRIPGGTSDIKRQLDTTYRAFKDNVGKLSPEVTADISIVWGGGDFFFDRELKPLGILQPLDMSPQMLKAFGEAFPQGTLAGVALYDSTVSKDGSPAPLWVGVCLSSFGICYNPDVYRTLQIPSPSPEHGWQDLANPKLAGFLALADPAHSGSSAVAYQMVIQHQMAVAEANFFKHQPQFQKFPKAAVANNIEYKKAIARGWKQGMSELLMIAANARYFTDSATLVPMDVARGEASAGMSIDFYSRVTQESAGAGRIQYITPIGATAITPDPVGILYGTQGRKLELANHFIEFLLSAQGQKLWILKPHTLGGPIDRSLRRMPIRRDVYGDRTGWSDDVDPFADANGFNQRGEWTTLFAESRLVWVAAWINSRDALIDAYTKILAVGDETRCAALLEHLANLPIEMSDVEKMRDERKSLEQTHGDVDVWRATQQMDWAATFRKHYREVAAEPR